MPLQVLMGIARKSGTRVGTKVGESKAKVLQMPLLVPRDLVKIADGESNMVILASPLQAVWQCLWLGSKMIRLSSNSSTFPMEPS